MAIGRLYGLSVEVATAHSQCTATTGVNMVLLHELVYSASNGYQNKDYVLQRTTLQAIVVTTFSSDA